jgi:hypothetical protein
MTSSYLTKEVTFPHIGEYITGVLFSYETGKDNMSTYHLL